ncbi:MAG TPA: HAD family hydrolase [Thermoplasmata archaeon]
MIRASAVTFDLWDTLIQEYPGGPDRVASLRIERIGSLLSSRGIVHSSEEIGNAYRNTGAFLDMIWSKNRDMSVRDQVLFMLTSVDSRLPSKLKKEDLEEIVNAYSEAILDSPPRLLPGVIQALDDVKSKGFKIGLICNTGRTPGRMLRVVMTNLGILKYFDSTIFSNEIFVRKPSVPAFRTALDTLKVPAKQAVHVGDHPENDILGARRAGMRAIQVLTDGYGPSQMADLHLRSLDQLTGKIERA